MLLTLNEKQSLYNPLTGLFLQNTAGLQIFRWDQAAFTLRNSCTWVGKYDQLYVFNSLIYVPISKDEFGAQIQEMFMGRNMADKYRCTTDKCDEIYKQLYRLTYLRDQEMNMNCDYIPFDDGMFEWRTDTFFPIGSLDFSQFFFTDTIHMRFTDRSGVTGFLKILHKLFNDEENEQKVLRFFAYSLLPEANNLRYHQIWHSNTGNNGKSQLAEHWGSLLGNRCRYIGLNYIVDDPKAKVGLRGALLNICSEIGALATGTKPIETLKAITTDRYITARDLYESQQLAQAVNFCRQLITTNNMPYSELMVADDALFSRFELIPVPYTWNDADWPEYRDEYGSTKHTFDQIFKAEASGIIHLILSFLPEIGLLTTDKVKTKAAWQAAGNSAIAFLHCDHITDTGDTEKRTLFEYYKIWCTDNNRKPLSYNVFFRIIKNRGYTEIRQHSGEGMTVSIEGLAYYLKI